MNYFKEQLLDRLAAEYVAGTLRGAARRRFEGLLAGNIPARHAVRRWELRLIGLSLQLEPVQPTPNVWQQIEKRVGPTHTAPSKPAPTSLRLWQSLAAGIAAIAVALGIVLATRTPEIQVEVQVKKQPVVSEHTAVVADATAPIWVVNAFPQLNEIRVTALRSVELASDRSFELWMLPDSGTAPVSLGVLPTRGAAALRLTAAKLQTLAASSKLAVSVEPAGGSPTGAPTGPIPYTAALLHTREQV